MNVFSPGGSMSGVPIWTIVCSCAAVSGLTLLWLLKSGKSVKPEYRERMERRHKRDNQRRSQLEECLSRDTTLTKDLRERIPEMSLLQLVQELTEGKLTAVQVLRAYQAKALEITNLHNCVTEFIPDAEERAAALDRLPESARGPLHGVPFSVKECIDVAGTDSTASLAKRLGQPAMESAPLVQTLVQLGAIPFCKTNIAQTLMSFTCSNPIWGTTSNIRDSKRIPGGSSGGEGVLISCGGSLFGIGTDQGGSVRVPALFSGCCSLRPTVGRLSCQQTHGLIPATIGVKDTPGFLARDIDTLREVMELVTSPSKTADMYRLDPLLPHAYWDRSLALKKSRLRIGYITDAPEFPVTPGVKRVLQETVQALKKEGHDLVSFELPLTVDTLQLSIKLVQPDNCKYFLRAIEGEEVDKSIHAWVARCKLPIWRRRLTAWWLEGSFRYTPTVLRCYLNDSVDAQGETLRRNRLTDGVVKSWQDKNLDILILPGFMFPAPPHEITSKLGVSSLYTAIFNLLNFPAGILPAGFETAADQEALKFYPTPYEELKWYKEVTTGAEGQPIGVQVAGLCWSEEQVLMGMQTVQEAINKHCRRPVTNSEPTRS